MYDIKPLEEEWEKYRKNRRKPYIVIGFAMLILGAGAIGLYYMKEKGFILSDRNSTQKVESKAVVFVENKPLNRLETEQSAYAVQLPQAKSEEVSSEIVEDLPISNDKAKRKKPRVKMNIVTTEMPTVKNHTIEEKPHKRVPLTISKISGSSAYKEVAQRFRETQDTDDSLFLAKAYYNQGQYKKAAYWALQTNNINSNIEESILIFAKAKVKLGQKHEAIRILSKYIKQTNSEEAKILLQKIKNNKV